MKIHHFIIDGILQKGEMTIVNTEIAHQIKNILKLQVGEKVVLCDGRGQEAEAVIINVDKKCARFNLLVIRKNIHEPDARIILYLSILKRENFEFAVQKAVEIGVAEIVPLISQRTIKTKLNEARIQKIIKEAAEQSERGVLPVLRPPLDLKKALANSKVNDTNLFFDPTGELMPHQAGRGRGTVGVFIGPEGGWTADEIEMARLGGCKIARLGKTILRGETAAIVATYLALRTF